MKIKTLAVNVLIFLGLLLSTEVIFRVISLNEKDPAPALWQTFHPYIMFRTGEHRSGSWVWNDQYREVQIPASLPTNNLGFLTDEDLEVGIKLKKEKNERFVVLLGGSAAWGVGATSHENAIHGRLEKILNEKQTKYKYSVFNLSMGGHQAFQEFIILSLYGPSIRPDWVIAMDATNDVAGVCAMAQGAGYPHYYSLMKRYIEGYTFGQTSPPFFRSEIENELLKYSVGYRELTKKRPIFLPEYAENPTGDPNAPLGKHMGAKNVYWEQVDKQLNFYINAQKRIRSAFPKANYILSTQPIVQNFEEMYGYTSNEQIAPQVKKKKISEQYERLISISNNNTGNLLGESRWPDCRDYFHPKSAFLLENWVAQNGRKYDGKTMYLNMGYFFPNLEKERKEYFIDFVHLNNAGQEIVAGIYAKQILSEDLQQGTVPKVSDFQDVSEDIIKINEVGLNYNCLNSDVGDDKNFNINDRVKKRCEGKKSCIIRPRNQTSPLNQPACVATGIVKWSCRSQNSIRILNLSANRYDSNITLSCP